MNKTICLSILVVIALSATIAVAQSPASVLRTSELRKRPFNVEVGGLQITITKLDDRVYLGQFITDVQGGYMILRLENATSSPITFDPTWMAFVDKEGKQIILTYERRTRGRVLPTEIRVLPNAKIVMRYNLSEPLKLPSKLYYREELLADVMN